MLVGCYPKENFPSIEIVTLRTYSLHADLYSNKTSKTVDLYIDTNTANSNLYICIEQYFVQVNGGLGVSLSLFSLDLFAFPHPTPLLDLNIAFVQEFYGQRLTFWCLVHVWKASDL